jgi:hypothetical protein
LERLAEIDFEDAWDRQIEGDAKSGRLDAAWHRSVAGIQAGRVKPLDEIIDNS